MIIDIDKAALLRELGHIQGVVEKKATIPALAMVLVEASTDGTLRFTATDLDNTVVVETDAKVTEGGELCISARKFFEIARQLPEGNVTIRSEKNNWATVKAGNFTSKLQGTSKDKFAEPQKGRFDSLTLATSLFRKLVTNISYAICLEESRYTLSGAKLEVNDKGLKLITTDGHRLAFVHRTDIKPTGIGRDLDLLIPKKALVEASKLADSADGVIEIGADDNTVGFKVGRRMLVSRKLNGNFPNYDMVIPKGNPIAVPVDADLLGQALRRVAIMSDERSHSGAFTFKSGALSLQAANAEEGEASEELPVEYDGEEVKIGFNLDYVREGLAALGASRVKWEIKDGNSQVLVRPVPAANEAEDLFVIIMPMRL